MLIRWMSPLFLFSALASADAHTIVRGIESRYQHARTLEASFLESYSEGGGRRVAESGTVYFSKPGRMRWEYEAPESKLFIVDGTNAWFYVSADHTASRAKVRESADWRTPIALLAGKANLNQLCKSIALADSRGLEEESPAEKPLSTEDSVLRCEPRNDAGGQLKGVFIEVDPEDFLVRVVIRQAGGIEMEFRFGNWQQNVPVEEAKFHFQPPPGVSIVDEGTIENELP